MLEDIAVPPCSSKTTIIEKNTSDECVVEGYRGSVPRAVAAHLLALLLCGLPYLVAKWRPRWRLTATCCRCQLAIADRVLVVHRESYEVCVVPIVTEEVGPDFPAQYAIPQPLPRSTVRSRLLEQKHTVMRYFIFRHLRYVWNRDLATFTRLHGLDVDYPVSHIFNKYSEGLRKQDISNLVQLHGQNLINISIPSYLSLLLEEVLHPFYIFQIGSIILWTLDDYVLYAGCILFISIVSVTVSLYETRRQAEMLHDMVSSSGDQTCLVRRPGDLQETVEVLSLVPGDLLVLPPGGCIMSCDAVLLTGTAIVNEAMLTGESVPVTKCALPHLDSHADEMYCPEAHKRHTIFAGTQVVQTRYYGHFQVLAVVIRTGFHTSKGELIRSILFPKPMDFKFYQDSVRFILVLFCIAGVGMAYCIYLYILRHSPAELIFLRTMDILTIVVPPALPAAMTVGTVYAQGRLRKQGIFCISPARINVCGKIKLVCFDKTGTLTEDGLELKGVLPCLDGELQLLQEDVTVLDRENLLLWSLASCHSLTRIEDSLTGDPLDLKMFSCTGWELEEPGDDNTRFDKMMPTVVKPPSSPHTFSLQALPLELGIIRQFTFSSSLARMSVIVRNLSSQSFIVFTKGAPEKLEDICLRESLPHDFHHKLKELTLQGYRVIAMATKELAPSLNWLKVHKMKRDEVERDMRFLGLLVMQNTLKPQTKGVISQLTEAKIKCVMITGDNLLTAVSVARDCGMVPWGDRVVIVEEGSEDTDVGRCLTFSDAEGTCHHDLDLEADVVSRHAALNIQPNSHLALSGRTWAVLRNHFPDLLPRILVQGTIFARMSPDQKAQLVEEFQSLGYVASMCGDGANDCGALKAAHVGVSLSEAEASVAAPFTSKIANISCIPTLVMEGRCALVTSFGVFKYMALYSMIQFISVLILYTNRTNLGDTQFLYIDLAITTTVAVLMGRTGAHNKIVSKRPLGSLVSAITLMSIMSQIFVSLAAQLTAVYYLQANVWSPIEPAPTPTPDPDADDEQNSSTTTVFLVSSYQYLTLATVFSKGPPYRKPFYSNYLYLLALLVLTGMTSLLLLYPLPALRNVFQLENLPLDFRLSILVLVLVNTGINIMIEILLESGTWVKKLSHLVTRKKRPKNAYKLVLQEISDSPHWPQDGTVYHSKGTS